MRCFPVIAFAFLGASIARADIPPPPDDYTGPATATVAGLTFAHQELSRTISIRDLGTDTSPFDRGGRFVILTGCVTGHANCAIAKKQGILGGIVEAVDGTNPDADVAAVQKAFSTAKKKVTLTLVVQQEGADGARTVRTMTLIVSAR